jgi:hypothetical protein
MPTPGSDAGMPVRYNVLVSSVNAQIAAIRAAVATGPAGAVAGVIAAEIEIGSGPWRPKIPAVATAIAAPPPAPTPGLANATAIDATARVATDRAPSTAHSPAAGATSAPVIPAPTLHEHDVAVARRRQTVERLRSGRAHRCGLSRQRCQSGCDQGCDREKAPLKHCSQSHSDCSWFRYTKLPLRQPKVLHKQHMSGRANRRRNLDRVRGLIRRLEGVQGRAERSLDQAILVRCGRCRSRGPSPCRRDGPPPSAVGVTWDTKLFVSVASCSGCVSLADCGCSPLPRTAQLALRFVAIGKLGLRGGQPVAAIWVASARIGAPNALPISLASSTAAAR